MTHQGDDKGGSPQHIHTLWWKRGAGGRTGILSTVCGIKRKKQIPKNQRLRFHVRAGNSCSLLPSHRVCIYIGPKLILGVCDLQPDDGDFDVDNHNRMIMIMGVHIDNDDFESTF